MYSLQKKKKAVDLLIKYDYAYSQVIRELGYPNSRTTLTKWNKEVKEMGKLKDCFKRKPKYSFDQSDHVEVFMNIHKNKNAPRDNETKSQQPDEYKHNNKKVEKQGKPETKYEDKITYGDIEQDDSTIPFKVLDPKYDNTKDINTSGYITKGQYGIKRKEVRKVYINEKYSHTETVKDTYILKEPINEQKWIGTKEKPPEQEKKPKPPKEEVSKPKDKMVIDGETWYHYKTFDNADACIANVNKIQEEHFREWEGGSMCWSEDLYYSLGK